MSIFGNINDIKFNSILLDFDGVIANTEPIFADFDCNLLNEILSLSNKTPDLNPEFIRTLAGNPGETKLRILSKAKHFDPDKYLNSFNKKRNVKRKTLFSDHPPIISPGLKRLLEKYKGLYGLATNKVRSKIENDLTCIGLAPFFKEKIFCLENGLKPKPEADILLKAAKTLNMDPQTTLYIGDNIIDIKAAINAQMIPAGFVFEKEPEKINNLKQQGASLIINTMEDLL